MLEIDLTVLERNYLIGLLSYELKKATVLRDNDAELLKRILIKTVEANVRLKLEK